MTDEYKKLEKHWSEYWAQFIIDNPNKLWNWNWLSGNPNLTWDIVQTNLDKKWNWFNLSQNLNITWDIIQQNRDKPWDWNLLSDNCMSKSKNNWINKRRLKHIKAYQIQRHWLSDVYYDYMDLNIKFDYFLFKVYLSLYFG